MLRPRLRCNGVLKSSASRINDGAMTILGQQGWILVTLRPDTCTLLGCGFDERAEGHRMTAFRSWCLFICCVVPVWFVLVFSNLDIPNGSSLPAAAGSFRSASGQLLTWVVCKNTQQWFCILPRSPPGLGLT